MPDERHVLPSVCSGVIQGCYRKVRLRVLATPTDVQPGRAVCYITLRWHATGLSHREGVDWSRWAIMSATVDCRKETVAHGNPFTGCHLRSMWPSSSWSGFVSHRYLWTRRATGRHLSCSLGEGRRRNKASLACGRLRPAEWSRLTSK